MSSLFDIGRSGLQSYRRALSVTGQNIANVNTDGYKRREAELKEVSAGQGDIYSVSSNSGLGVRVSDIKRSFDEFLLNKSRNAGSKAETSSAYLTALQQLQDVVVPGENNIGTAIQALFASLHDVSNVPSEMGPRVVALERGRAVAAVFNEVAGSITVLKEGLVTQANQAINDLNALVEGLLNVNLQLTKADAGASKSLLDNRDMLIDKISEFVEVNTSLDAQGRATLRLGGSVAGPKIIDAAKAYNVSVSSQDNGFTFKVGALGKETKTNQVINGRLAGIEQGYRTAFEIAGKIDDLAHLVARDMNAVHRKGVTLDGDFGGDMFVARRPIVSFGPTNVGQAYAEVDVEDVNLVDPKRVTFSYNANQNKWVGRDDLGEVVASGARSVKLPGMTIRFVGQAFDNDEIIVDPSRGAAESLVFALNRGEEFAAAAARLAYADSANASTAVIAAKDGDAVAASDLPALNTVFGDAISSVAATDFLKDGAVAIVPKNADKLDLVSLVQQGSFAFSVAAEDVPNVSMMTLSYTDANDAAAAASFSMSHVLHYGVADEAGWTDMGQIADLLNIGAITGSDGSSTVTLADIGARAAASDGKLVISMADGDPVSGSMFTGSGPIVSADMTSRNETASTIHVFTREGRHLAGEALDPSSQASLLTADNGFVSEAKYDSTYLNGVSSYLETGIVRRASASDNMIQSSVSGASGTFDFVRLADVDGAVSADNGAMAHAESASYTLTIEGFTKTVTVADFGVDGTSEDVATAMIKKFRDDAPRATLAGSAVTNIPVDGTSVAISFEGNTYNITMMDGEVSVSGGEEGRIYAFFSNDNKLYISSTSGSIGAEAIEVLANSEVTGNSDAATAFGLSVGTGPTPSASGFSAYDYRLSIDGAQIVATRTSSSATLSASASGTSSVGERLTMTDLPDEELIVIVTGGARKIAAGYDLIPEGSPTLASDITVNVIDASAGKVEFVDTATGSSLATRTLDSNQKVKALGLEVELKGILQTDDKFHITSNKNGSGDARNLSEIVSLQNSADGTGAFSDIFASIVSGLGSTLQSTRVTQGSAEALHSASLEIEAGFTGVSLDEEAANLIQQQQAYQASARILSTAREIFRTLIDSI
jgi:flagellar hook-associated protein 1 FlgK